MIKTYIDKYGTWTASIIIQRESYCAVGPTEIEAKSNLLKHLEGIIPIYEWKIEHAQDILKEIRGLIHVDNRVNFEATRCSC